jgi:hypothetical protein
MATCLPCEPEHQINRWLLSARGRLTIDGGRQGWRGLNRVERLSIGQRA